MAPATIPPPSGAEEARRNGSTARNGLSPAERRSGTAAAIGHLSRLAELNPPSTAAAHPSPSPSPGDRLRVASYMAKGSELDLSALHEQAAARGWALHLPRLTSPTEMVFSPWRPGEALVANRFGIGEPTTGAVAVADLDVVVLPCVAVDRSGTRVGHGAGFYDRALAGLGGRSGTGRPVLVGVAFEVQVVDVIDRQEWDVPLDVVVTDAGVIRPGG